MVAKDLELKTMPVLGSKTAISGGEGGKIRKIAECFDENIVVLRGLQV